MPALPSNLRKQLEKVCIQARDLAEAGARSALQKRGVGAPRPFSHFTAAEKTMRNCLRARGRQAGDVLDKQKQTQAIDQLAQELAYEYWHRMLFARFLAENHLLMHPEGVPVSLKDCEELAKTEGAPNGFVLAARYAGTMLPEIFRTGDVLLEVEFAPEQRIALERELSKLPRETFLADDSLGWVYQFWQSKKKKEVNKSGEKIDGRTLPAVTQLFTEDYMVQFLLHNTIGAWWFAKVAGSQLSVVSEEEARRAAAVPGVNWEYLRFAKVVGSQLSVASEENRETATENQQPTENEQPTTDNGQLATDNFFRPAAGTFDGWPKTLKEFTLLDPCCGSGHFLVAAFHILVPLRMHDEGLSARETVDAVLRENIFGLELDPRCTQIAAFALALAAWKYPGEDGRPLGYRTLPPLNIACSGIGPQASEEQWLKLAEPVGRIANPSHNQGRIANPSHNQGRIANPSYQRLSVLGREPIRNGLLHLHALFSDAPTLGSLIDPNQLPADLITADYETLKPYLEAALTPEGADEEAHEQAVAAAGMVKAAELLAQEYTLVATNVPYLGRGKQNESLKSYCEKYHPDAKADLAIGFVERCLRFGASGGTTAFVSPQNWLFLGTYKKFRSRLLQAVSWNLVARLGPRAFETISGEVVNVSLFVLTQQRPPSEQVFAGLEVTEAKSATDKANALRKKEVKIVGQKEQLGNPERVVTLINNQFFSRLADYARSKQGLITGDNARFLLGFWEIPIIDQKKWSFLQSAPESDAIVSGCNYIVFWEQGKGTLSNSTQARQCGQGIWGRRGVGIAVTRSLNRGLYLGEIFDCTLAAVTPLLEAHNMAVHAACLSVDFPSLVRTVDQALSVTESSFGKVPFDLPHWQKVAAEKYPNGLPKPFSSDPTQWLFNGHPAGSDHPLQVAVARLLGYRWPRQTGSSFPDCPALEADGLEPFADAEGIVGIPAVRTDPPGAERFLELLRAAYGTKWSNALLHDLLAEAGCKAGAGLDDWLRDSFFEQHCQRFHQRPFIWHIWDGRKDGFSCLVNYHQLDRVRLESLTYAHLGDWIKAQAGDAKGGKVGADLRLAAAQGLQEKLKLILAGEPPYDIFVRWKPLCDQAIGWNPDLNDGVRVNIRPFVLAGILRKPPNIKWTKDRGREPQRDKKQFPWFWKTEFVGERVNDVHLTNAEKQKARG